MNIAPTKVRLSYTKLGKVRFLGHRDVARLWERTLRKVDVPVSVSTGFTPRPRIAFGLALPTGAESLVELLDAHVDLPEEFDRDDASAWDELMVSWSGRIEGALPPGISLTGIHPIPSTTPSLQESVSASSWILLIDHPDVSDAVDRVLRSDQVLLERERKGEMGIDDVRPAILELGLMNSRDLEPIADDWPGESTGVPVAAMLATTGRGIRPTELVRALVPGCDPWDRLVRVLRTRQWTEQGGRRIDVLSSCTARAEVCA